MRWAWMVCLAGAAFAQGTNRRPIDELPWGTTLQEALDEAEECGAPLAVYLYKSGEEGEAPGAMGGMEAWQVLYRLALYRLDASKDSEDRKEIDRRWGSSCDLAKTPTVHLFGPDATWQCQVDSFADAKPLMEACQAALARLERRPIDPGFYRNARWAWMRASDALAEDDVKSAVQDLEVVVAIATNCGKDFRFTAEARKQYERLMTEGRAKLDELKKAVAAKDWKTVWTLGRDLAQTHQVTALGTEVADVLASIDGDPEASSALAEIAAHEEQAALEKHLAEAATHRVEALTALRTHVKAEEVPNEEVTVVFHGKGALMHEVDKTHWRGTGFVAFGYWIGEDRAIVLTDGMPLEGVDGKDVEFLDLKAKDDVERKVMALMRKYARWDGRPVVPACITPGDGGKLNVIYYDGLASDRPEEATWPCSRWSYGFCAVDVAAGTVEDRGHSK